MKEGSLTRSLPHRLRPSSSSIFIILFITSISDYLSTTINLRNKLEFAAVTLFRAILFLWFESEIEIYIFEKSLRHGIQLLSIDPVYIDSVSSWPLILLTENQEQHHKGEAASELVSSVDWVESATEPVASPISIVLSQPAVFYIFSFRAFFWWRHSDSLGVNVYAGLKNEWFTRSFFMARSEICAHQNLSTCQSRPTCLDVKGLFSIVTVRDERGSESDRGLSSAADR